MVSVALCINNCSKEGKLQMVSSVKIERNGKITKRDVGVFGLGFVLYPVVNWLGSKAFRLGARLLHRDSVAVDDTEVRETAHAARKRTGTNG